MAPQRAPSPVVVEELPQTTTNSNTALLAGGPLPPKLPPSMPDPADIPGASVTVAEHAGPSKTPYGKEFSPDNSLYNRPPVPAAQFTGNWPPTATSSSLWSEIPSSSLSWTTSVSSTPLSSTPTMPLDTTSCLSSSSTDEPYPWETSYSSRGGPWDDNHRGRMNNGGMYAAAAITPILVLAIIAGIAYFCMRKRKRQRAEAAVAAAQKRVDEMKMQTRSQPTTQAYMAPPLGPIPQISASNVHLRPPPPAARMHPIMYGPIPSGANGAYFTGIDTSDAISMNSASNVPPVLPMSSTDNDSLVEPPPPPYRPRSAAPPSFTNSSRHSSLRASMAPPLTSRTQLMERSPFDDPSDDDTISEISGPTTRRADDAMSAVSDISYQNEPVLNRSSL